jgi:SAM-dependent methyltransferase
MRRVVERELLDELPANDPGAIRSRRDLQWLNRWMRNAENMCQALRSNLDSQPIRSIVEIGAGDGTFLLRVAQDLKGQRNSTNVFLVDKQPVVTSETCRALDEGGWHPEVISADVFDFFAQSNQRYDAIIANLFMHHFSEAQLVSLLRQISKLTGFFIAVEPRRWFWSVIGTRLLWATGCNAVTRHDAYKSVRAGFADSELTALWPVTRGWQLKEGPANLSSHLFIARRLSNQSQ